MFEFLKNLISSNEENKAKFNEFRPDLRKLYEEGEKIFPPRVFKVQNMPDDPELQNEVLLQLIWSNVKFSKTSDGDFFIICTDYLLPLGDIKAEYIRPGSADFHKVQQLQERGYYQPDEEKPKLKAV